MHLKPAEFIDAIDQTLTPSRRRHLDGCAHCQDELAQLALSMQHVKAADEVPEPSPLLWTHMQARVRAATAGMEPGRPSFFGRFTLFSGRPAMVVGALAALAIVGVMVRNGGVAPRETGELVTSTAEVLPVPVNNDAAAEDRLDFVAQIASTLSYDELRQVVVPTQDAADAMVAQLTDVERAELLRLLKAETGSSE